MPSVDVNLETTAIGVEQRKDSVAIAVTALDGKVREIWARCVVGCDGARSIIRQAAEIELEDLGFSEAWVVVDLSLTRKVAGLPDRAVNICDPSRPYLIVPMPGDRYRFELMLLPGEDPAYMAQPEAVKDLISDWIPDGAAVVERQAVYTFEGLVAKRWRSGRVLLAGDAAHLMPPFLGQGMCSGIRDAANLAWKLDSVVSGRAPIELLDTYEAERRPHVRSIVTSAIAFGKVICTTDPAQAERRDAALLGGQSLPTEVSKFALPDLLRGPLVLEGGGELFMQPAISDGGRRLDDVVGQRFLVLGTSEESFGSCGEWWSRLGAMVSLVDQLPDHERLRVWMKSRGVESVVVRPDRYVLGSGANLDGITAPVAQLLLAQQSYD